MKRVLLIGPYGLGNLVMALPAIQALAATGQFSLEAGCLLSSTELVCRSVPPLDTLFARVHALHRGHGSTALLRTVRELRRSHFDAAVAMFPSARPHYNVLNLVLGAERTVGSRYPNQPWWHLAWLNSLAVPVDPGLHDTVQTARLLSAGLDLALPDPRDYVFRRLRQQPDLMGVHPGCKRADAHKRWGLAHFVDTLQQLHAAQEARRFRVFFGPDEAEDRATFDALLTEAVSPELRARVDLLDPLPLPQLFASIGECSAFLANDSGLMHIAAAQGVRTIGIFGPSDDRRTGPFAPECTALHTDIPCRPCHHTNAARARAFHCIHDQQYCLTQLEPERVVAWFAGASSRAAKPSVHPPHS